MKKVVSKISGAVFSLPHMIAKDNGLFEADPQINQRLFSAGFSPEQAQLVYDMAAEYLLPLISEMATELEAERELERLVERFGGGCRRRHGPLRVRHPEARLQEPRSLRRPTLRWTWRASPSSHAAG